MPKTPHTQIPKGKDGYVPQEALFNHFRKSVSDPNKDYNDHASVVMPINITPKQAQYWWNKPIRSDIEYIDAPGDPLHNTSHIKDPRNKKVHDKIGVIAPPYLEKEVRDLFDRSYPDIREREKMAKNGLTLQTRPLGKNVLGDASIESKTIRLDKHKGGHDESTMVHEGVHMLRAHDEERSNKITKSAVKGVIPNPSKVNIEESCTVAEQMARCNTGSSAYYQFVQVYDKNKKRWRYPTQDEAKRMMEEDKKLFTRGTGKPLNGKAAIDSVNENWSKSHIARLKITGSKRMAVREMETQDSTIKKDKGYQTTLADVKRRASKAAKPSKTPRKKIKKSSGINRAATKPAKKSKTKIIAKPTAKKPAKKTAAKAKCRAR